MGTTNVSHGTGCTMSNYGVWYTFTGDGQQTTISVNSSTNMELSIASGSCGSLSNVSCTDAGNPESYTFTTTNLTTYYVYVAHATSGSTTTGTFDISRTCTAPPANPDDCSSAVDLATLTAPYSNSTATGASNDFSTCASGTAPDHIYYMDVPNGYTFSMNQTYNNYDSKHSLSYGGACPGSTTIDCIDDDDYDPISWQNCTGSTQRVYWIQDGYNGNSGSYTITWSLTADPCPTCTPDMTINTTTYSATGLTTCGFGDDYDSGDACGSSYMNDEDIVIAWTPNTSACVNIELSNTETYTGFFITDNCPDMFGANCLLTSTSSGTDPMYYGYNVTAGTTYYITVSSGRFSTPYCTGFDLDIYTCPPPPSNDLCTGATSLPCGTTNLAGTTLGSTNTAHGTGCTMSNYGVWYKFTGDGQVNLITVTPEAGYDVELSLSTGTCGSLSNVGCLDQNGSGTAESTYINTVLGTTYYLYVADIYSSGDEYDTGDFTISRECIPPPANDLCSGATSLPCGTTNMAGSTAGATSVSDPASCASNFGVWYTFTGDGQETTISVDAAAGYNPELVFFSGACGSLTNITCENNTGNGGVEDYTFITTNGVTYYLYIAHQNTGGSVNQVGDFTISRTCSPVYTVTFFANGGTGYMPPQSSSSATSLDANTFTQSSCYFLNWNTAVNGTGTTYTDGDTYNFTSDVSLYAQWDCGSGCLHSIVLYDDSFDGWNLGATVDVTVNGTPVLSGLTLATGSGPETYTFPADNGDAIQVVFTSGGSIYDYECYFDVVDGYGNNIADDYYPDSYGLTWNGTGNCNPPSPLSGQDCEFPVVICADPYVVGNPGYSGTGDITDFTGSGNCTGGEKNSVWLQIDIAGTGDFNFTIMPNDGSNNSNGLETDYDFLLWRTAGTGATTDCAGITSSSGTALLACNYDSDGVTGVAPGGNAPAPIDSWFDGAFEPTVSVTAGDVLLLCIQNFSGSTQGFTLDLSSSGSGVVNYSSPSTIYWTAGSGSSDWTDIGNWGNCTVTPVCGVNAVVNSGGSDTPLIPTGDVRYVNDLTINNAATLTLQDNATLHVCGDFNNYGNIVFGDNSTIIFDGGSSVQTISGVCTGVNDFGHFIIDKSGGEVILNCNIQIAGDFTNLSNTSILNTNGYEVYLKGDFNNFNGNTTYTGTGTTGVLYFNGAANQNYDEGSSQLDLNHIVMNNTSTGVTLLTNMYSKTNTGTLTLADGVITTNGFEVYVQNDAAGAVSGHSTASYVSGNLRRNIQSTGAYQFPVGNATKGYQNAKVDFTAATSINNLLARFDEYPGVIPVQGGSECSTTYNLQNEDNGYWTITADANPTTGMYDITLYPTNATNTTGAMGWTVTKKAIISAGTWGLEGTCAASSTASVVIRRDIQGFSVFGVAQATVPLPVELLDFSGKIKDEVNHLYWETASELNSDYFEILRSDNGMDFTKIGEVDAAGNSNTVRYYDLIDYEPLQISYYKLVIVDYNGSKEYSNVVRLERGVDVQSVSVQPNPSNGNFDLSINSTSDKDIRYRIYDYTGRIIVDQPISIVSGINRYPVDLSTEANGIYTLIIFDENNLNIETIKVLKQQ